MVKRNDQQITVKFMKRAADNEYAFIWPIVDEIFTHPLEDIVFILQQPSIVKSGRAFHYVFPEADVKAIVHMFSKIHIK